MAAMAVSLTLRHQCHITAIAVQLLSEVLCLLSQLVSVVEDFHTKMRESRAHPLCKSWLHNMGLSSSQNRKKDSSASVPHYCHCWAALVTSLIRTLVEDLVVCSIAFRQN
eukprot:6492685-Amphidinium_carterae.7